MKNVSDSDLDSVLADSLYDGYLQSQKATIDRLYQHDGLRIPDRLTYSEAERFVLTRSSNASRELSLEPLAEARRISGLTPAALSATVNSPVNSATETSLTGFTLSPMIKEWDT